MEIFKKILRALYHRFNYGQIYNRVKYELAIKYDKLKCSYQPVWLNLYVTSRCTFRCRFCTNHAVNESGKVKIGYQQPIKDMSLETFQNIIDKFDKAMVATFCGVGEPFLNAHLLNMISIAKKKHMITEVVTNGSLLSNKLIDEIFKVGLNRISISLNESNNERHYHIVNTNKDFFPEIIKNIKNLVEIKKTKNKKIEIKISRVLTKSSLPLAEEFIDLGIRLGVDKVVFHNLIFSKITQFQLAECLFDEKPTVKMFEEISVKYKNLIKIDFPGLLKKNANGICSRCTWYWKNISIDAEGNVSGCGRFITPKREYGNFQDKDVFNSQHFIKMRESFNNKNILDCCKYCVESLK